MKLDVSFLPAYGAAFMLMFARIGTMLMLLPGLGEMSVPVRIRLSIALLLTLVLFPLTGTGRRAEAPPSGRSRPSSTGYGAPGKKIRSASA